MQDFLRSVRYHPAVFGYYGLDEAPAGGLDEQLQSFLKTVHRIDPYHPVYISGGSCVLKGRYDFADILGTHTYWCPIGWEPRTSPVRMAMAVGRIFEEVSEPNHRPVFVIAKSEWTSHSRRPPTPIERRVDVYTALINGGKSMVFFSSPIRLRSTMLNMKELTSEIHKLAPALLRRRPPQKIIVEPGEAGKPAVVQALFKNHPDGSSVLIVANLRPGPITVRWTLSSLGDSLKVTDFFKSRKYDVKDGVLMDRMGGWATRAFRIEGPKRKTHQPVVIKVRWEKAGPVPEKRIKEPTVGKNLLVNPGFEEKSRGWTLSLPKGCKARFVKEGLNGTLCLKLTKPIANCGINIYQPVKVKEGAIYPLSAWVKSKLSTGSRPG